MSRVAVVGGGGHAKVVIDLLRCNGHEVVACLDAPLTGQWVNGVEVIGGEDEYLPRLHAGGVDGVFVALGDNRLRKKVVGRIRSLGLEFVTAVGRSAFVSPSVKIGVGCAIMEGAVVNADAVLGDFAIVNTNASIDHDCVVGHYAHVAPGAVLAGCVTLGDSGFLGAGARVIPGITIAAAAVVGAGATVVRDIHAAGVWVGMPAQQIK
ncbi:acetyltransferase [Xanthomonas euvesicatoria]|uniref:acetyltransferase n=1 Tax=Xanthomonas euvesicatoria TaxID=456327 RepID=UPI0002266C37|nr:acetyltransferase [Xanthomonas euvesicatoria]AEO43743.1 Acetyltransferase [Xanthomonas euvesicatoria pv. citrumelo F1]MBV6670549.1 acetyltransferase [Xanthomonas euvesicatoria pv. alangii]MBV6800948.1 acetyltransferase [Xanthomonas campestris pv. lawsoniae]MBV6861209.1 acetyltransferase [Xanthomonas campestris pv. blepharidis]PPU88762.1 hexapeptide transferase [Xanthomonas euvesicatoria pv. citrumelonis]